MAVKVVDGNLLETNCNLILHQVNCQGKMNSGVAKQIRAKWSQVYEKFINTFNYTPNNKDLLGQVESVKVSDFGNQHVVNLYSQYKYGYNGERFTNYEALYRCLEQVGKIAREKNLTVALPYHMGCDRGGAQWSIVYEMIKFTMLDVDVTIYKYNG